jgi:Putative MetA-pathway of phenol degradation
LVEQYHARQNKDTDVASPTWPAALERVEYGKAMRARGQSQWGRSVMSGLRSGGIATTLVGFALFGFATGVQAQNAPAPDRAAKTLFEWIVGSRPEDKHDEKSQEQDRVDPDRPHFPEATTTVGNGRIVLESGYTFTKKDGTFLSNSYPEALLRVGVFADWFEFRIGQNFAYQRQTAEDMTTTASGAQDLYLGMKLGLTEQKGLLPQIAIIPQMTVPTGSSTLTAGRILPGLNVDLGWEVVKDFFGIELLIANNFVQDNMHNTGFQVATGLTGLVQITKKLEAFAEWDAFYPTGSISSSGPQQYAVGGLVYFVTPNLALDARMGVGLNSRSNNFLTGVGFAARY